MSFVKHIPCPHCGSSDAGALYSDGNEYCHKCQKMIKNNTTVVDVDPDNSIEEFFNIKPIHGLSSRSCELWGYKVGHYLGSDAELITYRNTDGSKSYKIRQLINGKKSFPFIGNKETLSLFGQWKWDKGKKLVITEGEKDAISVSQLNDHKWPVVSIPFGAQSAKKYIQKNLDWLDNFDEIILMFDNDAAGKQAALECCELITPGKAFIAELPLKDANEMLTSGRGQEVIQAIWNAKEYRPDGIEDFGDIKLESITELVNVGAETPFPILNEKMRGLKKKRLYTIAAREKSGKTTITKMLALKLIEQGHKVGVLYLEEDADEARVSTYALMKGVPMWKVVENLDCLGGAKAIQDGLKQLQNKGLYIYNHKGRFNPEILLARIKYMVNGLGCEYIVIDNLSISIACDTSGNNERKMIDKLVSDCVSIIQNSGATVINVVHLRKNRVDKNGEDVETVTRADIHGSGAFAKFSHAVIGLERNSSLGTTYLKILANRDVGFEGYCDKLIYDPQTGRLLIDIKEEF